MNKESIGYWIATKSEQEGFMPYQTKKTNVELINKALIRTGVYFFIAGFALSTFISVILAWGLR